MRSFSPAVEDYLKAILQAESEGEAVISATLAHWLSVSPPAVTMALRRLKKDGLVRVRADGHVALTATGRRIARRLSLRHHLIERMLAEMFGMEWYKVHDEAGKNYCVSGIYERDRRLLEFLEARGIRPGARLNIVERNYDKTLTLTSEAGTIALGGTAAEKVWVAAADRPARRSATAT